MSKSTIAATQILNLLFDEGVYSEIQKDLTEHSEKSGLVCAYGDMNGSPVFAYVQDSNINGGAMGRRTAEKLARLYENAGKIGVPVVSVFDSIGSYVDNATDPMMGYGEVLAKAAALSGVVPQISIVSGICSGSAALLACTGDFTIMTKESKFYLNPPYDEVEDSVENADQNGTASVVCDDITAAIQQVRKLLELMPYNNLCGAPTVAYALSNAAVKGKDMELIETLADQNSAICLNKGFGTSVQTAISSVGGVSAGVASVCGVLSAEDCAKLARFVRMCDAFQLPVITLVDSEGVAKNAVRGMAQLTAAYNEATCTKITVITGSAVGSVYMALANPNCSDVTFAYSNSVIAPMSPLSAAEFFSHDALKGASDVNAKRQELADLYVKENASAALAAANGAIDSVLTPETVREQIITALDMFSSKREAQKMRKHSNLPL